jgi:hypothetical protein
MENFNLKIEGLTESLKITSDIANKFISGPFLLKKKNEIIVKKDFFSDKYRVPNVCRYTIKNIINDWESFENKMKDSDFQTSKFNDHKLQYKSELLTIILILESPHVDEYTKNEPFEPIAPAQGKTGKQIFQNFDKIINKYIDFLNLTEAEYRIIIFNPIPYQTSLNYLHKQSLKNELQNVRDFVWKTLWNENNTDLKKEFRNNIEKLKSSLIINACTKGLSAFVESELFNSQYNEFTKCKSSHPFSWFSEYNRKLTFYQNC